VTDIALDRQVLRQSCPGCGSEFVVVRGSVFESDRPIGLYLIALHGHTAGGRLAHLALKPKPIWAACSTERPYLQAQ
jgi:hypothetical protein